MTTDSVKMATALILAAFQQGQESFILALTEFLETLPPNDKGEQYHLMQLPEGYNFEAAWRVGEQSAIGTVTVRFSVFTQNIQGCLENLKATAEMNNIAIVSCQEVTPWQYELKFSPRSYRDTLSYFIDCTCYKNVDNIPGDDASAPLVWSKQHATVAQQYGWTVVDEPGGPVLCLWGEPPQFDSEEDVWLSVFEQAQAPYSPEMESISYRDACRQAIDYIAQQSPDEYKRLAEFVEQAQQQIAENHVHLSQCGIVYRDEDEWYPEFQPVSDRD